MAVELLSTDMAALDTAAADAGSVAFRRLFSIGTGSCVGDFLFLRARPPSSPSEISGCAKMECEFGFCTPRVTGNRSLTSRGAEFFDRAAWSLGDSDCDLFLQSVHRQLEV